MAQAAVKAASAGSRQPLARRLTCCSTGSSGASASCALRHGSSTIGTPLIKGVTCASASRAPACWSASLSAPTLPQGVHGSRQRPQPHAPFQPGAHSSQVQLSRRRSAARLRAHGMQVVRNALQALHSPSPALHCLHHLDHQRHLLAILSGPHADRDPHQPHQRSSRTSPGQLSVHSCSAPEAG